MAKIPKFVYVQILFLSILIVMAIKHLLRRDWVVSLRHTLREGNAAADFLAKKGALSGSSFVILNEAPPDMTSILLADARGVEFVRP